MNRHHTRPRRVYAHSAPCEPGAVVVLALDLDPVRDAFVSLPDLTGRPFESYAVTAPDLMGQAVLLNGFELKLATSGTLPDTPAAQQPALAGAVVEIHPLSYTFIRFPPG